MLTTPNTIPDAFREDPQFKAWASVFDALSQCPRAGEVVCNFAGVQPSGQAAAFLWLEGLGRFGLIALGGHYSVDPAARQWSCQDPSGAAAASDPRQRAADAAMSMRRQIHERTDFEVFVIPVVVFTDMEPDSAIVREASRTNVCAVFGAHRLLSELDAALQRIEVRRPPSAEHVRNEAHALKRAFGIDAAQPAADSNLDAEPPADPNTDAADQATVEDLSLSAHSITITINRVDQLIVRPAPGAGPIIQN